MSIAGVVLAAGASTRLGSPKQLVVDANGESLVHRAARQLVDAGCTPVLVVVGAASEEVVHALGDLRIALVANDEWKEGVASSIRSAVAAARAHDHTNKETAAALGSELEIAIDALLLTTCDMPTVGVQHLQALCAAYNGGAKRVASRYVTTDGAATVGIPAIVGAREWAVLEALRGDRGAKRLFYEDGTVTVDLVGGNFDIDGPADVQALRDL